jgi:hypothetical protein
MAAFARDIMTTALGYRSFDNGGLSLLRSQFLFSFRVFSCTK